MRGLVLVKVTWEDAWQDQDQTKKEDLEYIPAIIKSVGFLVSDSPEGVTIAGCIDSDRELYRVLFVPRGIIKSIRYYK